MGCYGNTHRLPRGSPMRCGEMKALPSRAGGGGGAAPGRAAAGRLEMGQLGARRSGPLILKPLFRSRGRTHGVLSTPRCGVHMCSSRRAPVCAPWAVSQAKQGLHGGHTAPCSVSALRCRVPHWSPSSALPRRQIGGQGSSLGTALRALSPDVPWSAHGLGKCPIQLGVGMRGLSDHPQASAPSTLQRTHLLGTAWCPLVRG